MRLELGMMIGLYMVHNMTKDVYEMFELISGAYFGKQYYFENDNGMIYSRLSHSYMTKDKALKELLDEIMPKE